MRNKLGLKPVTEQPRVQLASYYTPALPTVESLTFPLGHAEAITPEMFCNDRLGDCFVAGRIEEIRLANALGGKTVEFSDRCAELAYHEITGWNPGPDDGTDVHVGYEFSKTTGIADADGNRHKVVAYAGLTPGDFAEMLVALSLFDMVGIGIQVPDYCEAQFEAGQSWHLVPGRHTIEGGHYIPVVGATDRHTAQLYSWGALGGITAPFYAAYNTVAVVALTEEMFTDGKSPEGVDFARMAADLKLFDTGPVSEKAPRRSRKAEGIEDAPVEDEHA